MISKYLFPAQMSPLKPKCVYCLSDIYTWICGKSLTFNMVKS